jgi:pimeloyl-ACP methyl ester carboxylesterase
MMADDLNAVLDSLHVDSAYVIGWSDGGINGLLLALRHPEKVRKLAETGANLIPDTSVFDPAGNASLDASIADLRSTKWIKSKESIQAASYDANRTEYSLNFITKYKVSCTCHWRRS